MPELKVVSDMKPQGDQPQAIDRLAANLLGAQQHNVLLGVTGSGKTFTVAHVIERLGRPTLPCHPGCRDRTWWTTSDSPLARRPG